MIEMIAGGAKADARFEMKLFPIMLGHLKTCRPKEVAQHAERASACVNAKNAPKYHATLLDAERSDFGNDGGESCHDWIEQMTLAFFDADLRGDAAAKAWLDSMDIEDLSSGSVTFERK
jgi:hypothetical protein